MRSDWSAADAYVGLHPCFIGPHSRFTETDGVPTLHAGYRERRRYNVAPGISPEGLRAKAGAVHIPLGEFVETLLDNGFVLERFEEVGRAALPTGPRLAGQPVRPD